MLKAFFSPDKRVWEWFSFVSTTQFNRIVSEVSENQASRTDISSSKDFLANFKQCRIFYFSDPNYMVGILAGRLRAVFGVDNVQPWHI